MKRVNILFFEKERLKMLYYVCFVVALVASLAAVIGAVCISRMKKFHSDILNVTNILLVGVVVSAAIMFLPIYMEHYSETGGSPIETALISVHNVIRLFVVDGDFDFVIDNIAVDGWINSGYMIFFAILFLAAPLLTFGFVLSFFKNISAYVTYYLANFRSDVYVFSALTEKSLVLARSIVENGERDAKKRKRLCIFADVNEKKNEQMDELIKGAHEIGALCFKQDVSVLDLSFHSKKTSMKFFTITEDPSLNTSQALNLLPKYKYRPHSHLFVFSSMPETEMLLNRGYESDDEDKKAKRKCKKTAEAEGESQKRPVQIKIRRVNEVRSLINDMLYSDGYRLIFDSAKTVDEDGDHVISAVIIGLGKHGKEMLKALVWLSQMTGYKLYVNVYDADKLAASKFRAECPELMDERFNGRFDIKGESRYSINIHSKVDIDSYEFASHVSSLPTISYALVCLGDDEKNIAGALKLRSLCMRAGFSPIIQSIVYSVDKNKALRGIANHKNVKYDIEFIGDRCSTYSENVIIHSEIEQLALERHKSYGADEESFWKYDYNYRSSTASAIHKKMKELCGISGITLPKEQRSEEQLWAIRELEHCRWNAYMRTEGFSWAPARNDMAKQHHCLVPFDALPLSEQVKDDD